MDLISRYQAQAKLKEICERFGYLYDDRYGEGSSGYVFIHAFDDVPSIPSAFEGMTNGEIIKTLFPNVGTNFSNVLDLNLWWNAKYKAESEGV